MQSENITACLINIFPKDHTVFLSEMIAFLVKLGFIKLFGLAVLFVTLHTSNKQFATEDSL